MSAMDSPEPGAGVETPKVPIPPPSAVLAEEHQEHREDAEQLAGIDPLAGYWPPVTLRDIAYCVGYGVLSKDDANKAAKKLLEKAGLLDGEA